MTLLGYLIVLTGLTCCTGAPAAPPAGSCTVPPRFDEKELQGDWDNEFYDPKTQAQYQCRPGFSRLGAIIYECRDGKWVSTSRGQCKKKSCGHPGDIDFGTFELRNEEEFVFGAVVEYFCNDGYQMISKHRTRECTATGWSNYRPECEVRYCPPVQVNDNVNLLTTSYEEEYSVGQVIRFECKNPGQKLKGSSEIFCTSEGEWNAPTPTCEEVSCRKPMIDHGSAIVSNPNHPYKDKDTIEFVCDPGYRASTTTVITCTKNDWSPTPVCQEIVCYQETVQNGKVQFFKETYKEGDAVTLTCNDGYQIEHKPEEPRKCTARGWSPPLKCISKSCLRPKIPNGYDTEYWYSFPKQPGRSIYFYCSNGFLTSHKIYYGTIWCTSTGWSPEPKCYRQCKVPSLYSINANIQHTHRSQLYTEGDKLTFQCHPDYSTLDGQKTGDIECLPDGTFSDVKCHRTCPAPVLDNVKDKLNRNVFAVGTYFIYECNKGYTSSNNKAEGRSECSNGGWWPEPKCKEIQCTLERNKHLKNTEKTVKSGEVVHFKCPENFNLEGSSSSQCFYYGWSPAPPICKGEKRRQSLPILDVISPEEAECPPISAPPNAQIRNNSFDEIEIECNPGYLLYGSEKLVCKDGIWPSPPWCIEKVQCSRSPPRISNGEFSTETDKYYTGSTVKYKCFNGYHIIGSDENTCMDGKWLSSPTCVGNPCGYPPEVNHGRAKDVREYKHGESAAYECSPGYKLHESVAAVCLLGNWTKHPKCIYSSCGAPPKVKDAIIRGVEKTEYYPDEKVFYECVAGYTIGKGINHVTCEDSTWTEPPLCKRVGQPCGPPPVVQFGDIIQTRLQIYRSDSSVTYKCANFHKLEGNQIIKCKDGEWDKQPVCREPCTVKEIDMQKNNILLRYKYGEEKAKKMYSEHFDNMTFECKPDFEISNPHFLRIQCLDGVLKYPKCLKKGSCVLQPEEMTRNNIHYNISTELEHGQTIEFECEARMVPENDLRATCSHKKIRYPKCSPGRSCLPPNIPNASVHPDKEGSFESGSSVEVKCEENYVLNGHINVNCENGEWDDLPQCLKPCTISANSLDEKHIELKSESLPEMLKHGTEINAKCKANFKRPGTLIVSCNDGTMKYPKCFSGGICRISQQDLDNNFLELDEKHENEVFYEEKEYVRFKCKTGYINKPGLTGICTKLTDKPEYTLTYPTCKLESAV